MNLLNRWRFRIVLLATYYFVTGPNGTSIQAADAPPTVIETTVPQQQRGTQGRLAQKAALAKTTQFDLILIGDSITDNLDNAEYKSVWDQFYAPRNALNLGFSAARTQNLLWTINSGVLDNQKPKIVMLLIGTNNTDDRNYRTHYTVQEVAAGIKADVAALRAKLPDAKILMLRVLPYGAPTDPRRLNNDRASELAAADVVDGQHVFYADVNHVFLAPDGTIPKELMPDALHPSPAGALLQAQAIDPILAELLSEAPRDTQISKNTALLPVSKLENDSYDWWKRHAEELEIKKTLNPEIVLIGDSITHFWGGLPLAATQNGPQAWQATFGGKAV